MPVARLALFLRAVGWIVRIRVLLPWRRLDALHRMADHAPRATPMSCTPEAASWAVHAAARRLPGTTCLARSIALHALLRRAGYASSLRIGVKREGDRLDAHAWVLCDGQAIDDERTARDYTPFEPFHR